MKTSDYRTRDPSRYFAPLLFQKHHAWWCMCRRAFQRGYRVGRRGADHAVAPYLKIPMTKELIRYWRDGKRLGLERYEEKEGRSLLKMKAVGGVQ